VTLAQEPGARFVARAVGWILIATGAVALAAAVTLMAEKILMLEDPLHVPACTIDAVLACGSVMTSDQAAAFGIPNPLIGIAGFGAVVAFGATLAGGAALPRPLWLAIQAGLTFAVGFVHWLFFQSLYRIEALCPYCMVVWVATITAFLYVSVHNVGQGHLRAPRPLATLLVRYHGVILTAWLAVLALLVGEAFWDYWRAKL